jgi:hypothetical protein
VSWYWNEIGDKRSAQYATTTAVWISYLIATVSALVAILSLAYRKPTLGLNGWALVEAGLFAVVGWGIAHLSRVWAVVGFSLYLLEASVSIGTRGLAVDALTSGIMAILFLIVYLNALRGTFAYHRYERLQAAQPSEPTQLG